MPIANYTCYFLCWKKTRFNFLGHNQKTFMATKFYAKYELQFSFFHLFNMNNILLKKAPISRQKLLQTCGHDSARIFGSLCQKHLKKQTEIDSFMILLKRKQDSLLNQGKYKPLQKKLLRLLKVFLQLNVHTLSKDHYLFCFCASVLRNFKKDSLC